MEHRVKLRLMIDDDLRARQTLAKAAIRAAEWLGLDQEAIAALLGKHRSEQQLQLEPATGEWCNALALIDIATRLERLAGGQDAARTWMRGPNLELGQPPIRVIAAPTGLDSVRNYLGRVDR